MLKIEEINQCLFISLNYLNTKNSLSSELLKDLGNQFIQIKKNAYRLKWVVLTHGGSIFCSGAHLKDKNGAFLEKGNLLNSDIQGTSLLNQVLYLIHQCPLPVIAVINGQAYGGGVGLLSACDYVLSTSESHFTFSELKLGLIPAVISAYIIKKIGKAKAYRYFFSAKKITADMALTDGLIDDMLKSENWIDDLLEKLNSFVLLEPKALKHLKYFFRQDLFLDPLVCEQEVKNLLDSQEFQIARENFLNKTSNPWTQNTFKKEELIRFFGDHL